MKSGITIMLILSSLFLFCQKRGSNKKYSENLSKVEPSYSYNLDSLLVVEDSINEIVINPQYDITSELNFVLDSVIVFNEGIKYIKGYKILAYSGSSQEEALEVRGKVLQSFESQPDFKNVKTDFVWHQPSFRLYVGEYQKRLDAVRMSEFLKSYKFDFKDEGMTINPLVVPSNIKIRE